MTTATPQEARTQIVNMVREFVRREVEPVASRLDKEDIVPHDLIDKMKEMGLFGITVPEEYGGLGLDYTTFASIFEEISKGFMSLTGPIGTHHILTYVLTHYGTEEQKQRFLPDLAAGRKRGGLALTAPGGGSDVAALETTADKDGEEYVINGTKMFISNGRYGDAFCLLARTHRTAEPQHKGLSCFVVEKGGPVGVGDDVTQPFLSVAGQTIFMKQETVQVFTHTSPAAAQAEAGLVDPTGFTVGTISISWAAPPHVYLRETCWSGM